MKTSIHLTQSEIEQAIHDYVDKRASTGYYDKFAGKWQIEWVIEAGGVACDAHNEIVAKENDTDTDN